MADEPLSSSQPLVLRGINWRETFPFTHIFRGFRIAIHPSKLILGLIALLSLYAGGRVLDGVWPARHLAVPGEVNDYEHNIAEGGNSEQFARHRNDVRDQVESAYADKLVAYGIETDPKRARDAAYNVDRLPEVKAKIIQRRDQIVADADRTHRDAIDAAGKLSGADADRARRVADDSYNAARREAYHTAYADWLSAKSIKGVGLFHAFFDYESFCVNSVVHGVISGNWLGTRRDERGIGVVWSVINFFTVGPVWLMRFHPLYFILFTLLFLTIWAIFGGAICRIAAVHVARDEKLSVRAALAFSLGKFLSFVSAPLIPLVIVLIVGLVPLVAGFLSSIPWGIGAFFNIVMGALFVLILAAGFVMTLVLLGTFGGFNLMYPTIAVEGSDSFDAISRSFSYVYARPWRMLFYTLVAIVYGALTYLFVWVFVWMMLSLTHHFVGAGMFALAPSSDALWTVMWRGPSAPPGRLSYDIDFLTLRWYQDLAAFLVAFWVYLVVGMLGAYAISFYFSANSIIYFLMRHEVDATEMDDVYLEQSEEDFADATAPPATVTAAATAATTATVTVSGSPAPGSSASPASPPAEAGGLASPDAAPPT